MSLVSLVHQLCHYSMWLFTYTNTANTPSHFPPRHQCTIIKAIFPLISRRKLFQCCWNGDQKDGGWSPLTLPSISNCLAAKIGPIQQKEEIASPDWGLINHLNKLLSATFFFSSSCHTMIWPLSGSYFLAKVLWDSIYAIWRRCGVMQAPSSWVNLWTVRDVLCSDTLKSKFKDTPQNSVRKQLFPYSWSRWWKYWRFLIRATAEACDTWC